MQAVEIEMPIANDGTIQLPEQYQDIYGRNARFVILLLDDDARGNLQKGDLIPNNPTPQFGNCNGMLTIVAEDEEK